MKETAEVDFFEEMGWITDAKKFLRTHVVTNTKLLYAQQKWVVRLELEHDVKY